MTVKMDSSVILIKTRRKRMIAVVDRQAVSMKDFIIYFNIIKRILVVTVRVFPASEIGFEGN